MKEKNIRRYKKTPKPKKQSLQKNLKKKEQILFLSHLSTFLKLKTQEKNKKEW